MFRPTAKRYLTLRAEAVTSSARHGGRRTPLYAFTEHDVAILSSVLGSQRAIAVNIEIMRTFARKRALAYTPRFGQVLERT